MLGLFATSFRHVQFTPWRRGAVLGGYLFLSFGICREFDVGQVFGAGATPQGGWGQLTPKLRRPSKWVYFFVEKTL